MSATDPCPQSALRLPLQTKAAQFLRKLDLRAHIRTRKQKPSSITSSVSLSIDNAPRSRSVDVQRKPTLSSLVARYHSKGPFRPAGTTDSSQDVPSCDSSPSRPQRHRSTCGRVLQSISMNNSFHSLAFIGNQTIPENAVCEQHPSNTGPTISPPPALSPEAVMWSATEAHPQSVSCGSVVTPNTPRLTSLDTSEPSGNTFVLDDATPGHSVESSSLGLPAQKERVESSESVQQHRSPDPLPTTTLPSSFRVMTEGGAKLSPTVITRQPFQTLSLPPVSVSASTPSPPSRPRVRLRNVPSLSVYGHSDADQEPNDENESIGGLDEADSDEEEDFELLDLQQSDDDEELPSAGPSTVQTSGSSLQSLNAGGEVPPSTSLRSMGSSALAGPSDPAYIKYPHSSVDTAFTRFAPQEHTTVPCPLSPSAPPASVINTLRAQKCKTAVGSNATGVSAGVRQKLGRVASRSMINLSTSSYPSRHPRSDEAIPASRTSSISSHAAHASNSRSVTSDATAKMAGRLMRLNSSMPTFHPASDPPPYPSFDPCSRESRAYEDEGRERLPAYSNSLYLTAIMPRKVEFSAPGVQAKDRKWRRVLCELEGTAFRVYKCPSGSGKTGILGQWWENRVGVRDKASGSSHQQHHRELQHPSSTPRERERRVSGVRTAKFGLDQPSVSSTPLADGISPTVSTRGRRSGSYSSRATEAVPTSTRTARRTSGMSFLSSLRTASTISRTGGTRFREPSSPTVPLYPESRQVTMQLLPVNSRDSHSTISSESQQTNNRQGSVPGATTAARTDAITSERRESSSLHFLSTGRQHPRAGGCSEEVPDPTECELIRAYTLQNAESGLGNDYQKRKHVIRVRLEGEQFLLQAPDVPSIVEWIEGLHAGTNIALDLDQRTMPRGPVFPRRRRRRHRCPPNQRSNSVTSQPHEATIRMA